jgi:hypothetical protein
MENIFQKFFSCAFFIRKDGSKMNMDEYVKEHGYWYASCQEFEDLAKANPNLIPLSEVFAKLSLPVELTVGFYVPSYFAQMNKQDELPGWVWRKCGFEFQPIKVGDYVHWEAVPGTPVLVKVIDIREDKYEISTIGSDSCRWVLCNQISKIN